MWGTQLGCWRQQAMISWDYDADLAVFVRPGVDFNEIWTLVSAKLKPLGYVLIQHTSQANFQKFRVCPNDPLSWNEWKELYQEVAESSVNSTRQEIIAEAARRRRQGAQPRSPHGSNCIDVEVYWPKVSRTVNIRGSKPIVVAPSSLFPLKRGIFGPMVCNVFATPVVLRKEYGSDCLTTYRVKTISSSGRATGFKDVSNDVRRSAFPSSALLRCPSRMLAE